jgi:tRNA (adenine57-N1/adenine58-N1)-methyltransferase catalytic subunit
MGIEKRRNDPTFAFGDRIQLTDPKGKIYSFTLKESGQFHTHKGWIDHKDIVGLTEGRILETNGGLKYQAFKPLYGDYVLGMGRGATIVYPKDAAYIVGLADIKKGDRVLEAGVGSGALSIALLQAIGDEGYLHSVERRAEFADISAKNISEFFGEEPSNWKLTIGSLEEQELDEVFDRVVLDMLAPWEQIDLAAKVLRPGGVFISYVATTTQLSNVAEGLKSHGYFTEPESLEVIIRPWHHDGLAVRPEHRMIGHTGFLTISRLMSPDQKAMMKRRRPSKGAYGVSAEE